MTSKDTTTPMVPEVTTPVEPAAPVIRPAQPVTEDRELRAVERRAAAELKRQQKELRKLERRRTPPKTALALEKWVQQVELGLFEWEMIAAPRNQPEDQE